MTPGDDNSQVSRATRLDRLLAAVEDLVAHARDTDARSDEEIGLPFEVADRTVTAVERALADYQSDYGDAESVVGWLRDAAVEIEKSHAVLDAVDVPRRNPESGRPFTLAARIAHLTGVR